MIGVKCPKCGLMQMSSPSCKSCGTELNGPAPHYTPPPAVADRPISPPRQSAGPIYRSEKTPSLMLDEPPPLMAHGGPPAVVQEAPPQMAQEGTLFSGPGESEVYWLTFHGTGGSLFGIQIVNMLLTILTLGGYYFWGKSKVRTYILSQIEFAGDRFAYHGTGKELLMGFLKAVLIFGVPLAVLLLGPELGGASETVNGVSFLIAYGVAFLFVPVAKVGARRYRMSRTSWRGIRFSFRGQIMDFFKLLMKGQFLTMLTFGLYYPYFETRKHGFMVDHSYFGNQKFNFDGHGRDLWRPYITAMLLAPFTLGLYWFWFFAEKHRYFWDNTSVGYARFRSTMTGGAYLWLWVGNILLLVVTLGLAWPWVVVRNAQFTFRYLTLEGSLDLAEIQQEAQFASPTGEGLASFLDLDSGFDFG